MPLHGHATRHFNHSHILEEILLALQVNWGWSIPPLPKCYFEMPLVDAFLANCVPNISAVDVSRAGLAPASSKTNTNSTGPKDQHKLVTLDEHKHKVSGLETQKHEHKILVLDAPNDEHKLRPRPRPARNRRLRREQAETLPPRRPPR